MAGLQSVEGRMMIDSVIWAQYINVTDREADRQTDRQTATSPNAALMHCIGRQKSPFFLSLSYVAFYALAHL